MGKFFYGYLCGMLALAFQIGVTKTTEQLWLGILVSASITILGFVWDFVTHNKDD